MLVGAYKALGGRRGRVRLVATNRAVLAAVQFTGLLRIFPVHASTAEAVRAVRATKPDDPTSSGEQPGT